MRHPVDVSGRVICILAAAALSTAGGDVAGVRNFFAVNEHIYRGAQPTGAGFASLSRLGVKTVIDLRGGQAHEAAERAIVQGAGMRYVHVPMSGYGAPSDEQIQRVLALLDDSAQWPVFVHCQRGADRTGTVVACYRIAHDHWNSRRALEEAESHGMRWTEFQMKRYILRFRP